MGNYVRAVWTCRYFWLSLVLMDLRTRYRRSMLGIGWSLLHPIAMTAILAAMLHQAFNVPIRDFAPFVLVGFCFWVYILNVAIQGCLCFTQGEAYIRQFPAPIAIYPLRTVLGGGFHFLVALSAALFLSWCVHGFQNLAALLSLIPTILLLLILGWSTAVLFGFANVYFHDTKHITEVGLQALFYMTPIMYPPKFIRTFRLGWIVEYNPLGLFMNLLREPILEGHWPSATTFAAASVVVLLVASAATLTLVRLQRRLIFHL